MKPFLVMGCFIFLPAINSCSGTIKEKNVPVPVKNSFAKTYGSPRKIKWEKEGKNEYEVSFVLNGKDMSVVYSDDGILQETETEIKVEELPDVIIDSILKNYSNPGIREAAKIIKNDGRLMYEAEVNGKDLYFDSTGKLLKPDN